LCRNSDRAEVSRPVAGLKLALYRLYLVAKAVPVLTGFVTKSGGANVGKLLAGVLK
jgi:hypothetical protein